MAAQQRGRHFEQGACLRIIGADLYPFLELVDGAMTPPPDAPVETPENYYSPLS